MLELGMKSCEVAGAADLTETDLRYFALLNHDPQTLERLAVALGWPPDHLNEWWSAAEW